MSNKQDVHTMTKKEEMSQEIRELEFQILAEKSKLNIAENDQRLEDHKRNFLEVRKNLLNQSIEFYKINIKKIRNKLAQRLIIHSKFSMAEQFYDKLLKTYAENYLQNEPKVQFGIEISDIYKHILDFQKQVENWQKQMELLKARMEENSLVINNLLKSLHLPIV